MKLRNSKNYEAGKCKCQKWFPHPNFKNLCSGCYQLKYPVVWSKLQEENCRYIPKHQLDQFIVENKDQLPQTQWKILLACVKEQLDVLPLLTIMNYIKRHNNNF